MQAPPLAALAGGAWASHRPAILAAPASLRRSRRGALRLPAWRAAGGGRAPRVPAKGAVLASDMGAEEVVGPSPLLDARSEQGPLLLLPNAPGLTLHFYSVP
jgi:glycerol-3-phosphate O-acyltransferase